MLRVKYGTPSTEHLSGTPGTPTSELFCEPAKSKRFKINCCEYGPESGINDEFDFELFYGFLLPIGVNSIQYLATDILRMCSQYGHYILRMYGSKTDTK